MDPIVKDAWKYYSNGSYGAITYYKTALVLKTLENMLGQKEMDRVMRAFFMQVKFTHPDTRDFIRIVSEAAGKDLSPVLTPMLYGTGTVDFRVARVRNVPDEKPAGYDLSGGMPKLYAKDGVKGGKGTEKGKARAKAVRRTRRPTIRPSWLNAAAVSSSPWTSRSPSPTAVQRWRTGTARTVHDLAVHRPQGGTRGGGPGGPRPAGPEPLEQRLGE